MDVTLNAEALDDIEMALAAGAFGVPTFVTDAGEVFFGQDRLPVLRHHLWGVTD